MGYAERTIRLDFPELGKGCFVVIKNPALEPLTVKLPLAATLTDEERISAVLERSQANVAQLVVDWCVWDPADNKRMPLPAEDPSVMSRCPSAIMNVIATEVAERTNPFRRKASTTTTS